MNLEQNSFITNQKRFLSEIINGILPKSSTVDILVGYFYYSGFELIQDKVEDKPLRILVGLDVEIQISGRVREVDQFLRRYGRRLWGLLTLRILMSFNKR